MKLEISSLQHTIEGIMRVTRHPQHPCTGICTHMYSIQSIVYDCTQTAVLCYTLVRLVIFNIIVVIAQVHVKVLYMHSLVYMKDFVLLHGQSQLTVLQHCRYKVCFIW